jgi:hypothetical protein
VISFIYYKSLLYTKGIYTIQTIQSVHIMKNLSNLDWGNIAQWVAAVIALIGLIFGPGIIRTRTKKKKSDKVSPHHKKTEVTQVAQVGSGKIRIWSGLQSRIQRVIQIGRPTIEIGNKKDTPPKKRKTKL